MEGYPMRLKSECRKAYRMNTKTPRDARVSRSLSLKDQMNREQERIKGYWVFNYQAGYEA